MGLKRSDSEKLFQLENGDNGAGIPEEVLPHFFKPFYATKDSEKNTLFEYERKMS